MTLPPYASPAVHKLARELGVCLQQVRGSGALGRVTAADVRNHVSLRMRLDADPHAMAAVAQTRSTGAYAAGMHDFARYGPIERRDLSRVRRRSGSALQRSWSQVPHVTNHEDADITELEQFRLSLNREFRQAGVKFTLQSLLIKACIVALKRYPEFNASLDGEQLVLKRYYHIGFATDTPDGLLVPVIRNADRKGLTELAVESAALAAKARAGKLAPADMQGGSFTVSSLGGIGGKYFTPIINAPEVAILGVGKGVTQVGWVDAQAVPRLMLPLSLSWDHRAVDGAAAARFNACLAEVLGDIRVALL